ncbi:RibD family protein [Polymorphum gilvum]|uniref:Bifunctional deaminase-reductase domain protein n=1 Tax=Polymorphum gilvum (strain LMG 25793 / CGMCC 1.9160 / SL003B-26A1) TaxID=991905 RepID=F2J5H4_POLGS|nr:RibD family protein [Polymorphum gilvum]ADZ72344.1 Bifunctional deaminase-reductase domain protein [Polymorphum gilvum SL003B-26A1]
MTIALTPDPRHPDALPETGDGWAQVLAMRNGNRSNLPLRWTSLFSPFFSPGSATFVVGQLGQSLDGRIATVNGQSKYINGPGCLSHLHRLRAVCDAVVIGAGTAIADDPQLTVRLVDGPHPARVLIDPRGRLPATLKALRDDGTRRFVVTLEGTRLNVPESVEIIRLAGDRDGHLAPRAIVEALASHGFRRLLVEGGSWTISRFLSSGCLDRLHLLIAPMIIGAGQPGLELNPIECLSQALRPTMTAHRLGDEVLLDCDLRG